MKFIKRNLFNILVLIIFMLINFISIINKDTNVLLLILLCIISVLIIIQKEFRIIKYMVYFFVASVFIQDLFWIYTGLSVPLSIRFYIDIVNIALIFKLIITKNKLSLLRDPIIIVILILIIINIIQLTNIDYSFYNLFLGVRTYFRWTTIYIIIANYNIDDKIIKNQMSFIFIIQIITVMFESFIPGIDRDNISGTFGLYGTNWLLCFISIVFFYSLFKEKKNKYSYLSCLFVGFMIIMGEIKVAFIMYPIIVIIVYVIISNITMMKKIAIIIVMPILLYISAQILYTVYPNFEEFFTLNKVMEYTQHRNPAFDYSRPELVNLIYNNELDTIDKKIFGKGMGFSVPADFSFYNLNTTKLAKGREIKQIQPSQYYLDHSTYGYQTVSFNMLILDNGIIGVIIFLFICIYVGLKAYKLQKKFDKCKAVALTYIAFLILFISLTIYTDVLHNIQSSFLFWAYSGYIINIYNKINKGKGTMEAKQ